jgi:hypothetical protein
MPKCWQDVQRSNNSHDVIIRRELQKGNKVQEGDTKYEKTISRTNRRIKTRKIPKTKEVRVRLSATASSKKNGPMASCNPNSSQVSTCWRRSKEIRGKKNNKKKNGNIEKYTVQAVYSPRRAGFFALTHIRTLRTRFWSRRQTTQDPGPGSEPRGSWRVTTQL